MKDITEQTTLGELAGEVAELGHPFVTLMRGHPGSAHKHHVTVYAAGIGSFHGGGDTVAIALDVALAELRIALFKIRHGI